MHCALWVSACKGWSWKWGGFWSDGEHVFYFFFAWAPCFPSVSCLCIVFIYTPCFHTRCLSIVGFDDNAFKWSSRSWALFIEDVIMGFKKASCRAMDETMAIIVTNNNNQRGAPYIPTVTKGQCQKGVSYKILTPWVHTQSPHGCTSINQSEEWKPLNTAQYE